MATINLTDLNESPAMGDQVFSINENVPAGTVAGTMNATDPDQGQTLTYSIRPETPVAHSPSALQPGYYGKQPGSGKL
ncbi:MAG: cadherin repeat domain-containing protein [Lentimicrobium sp.]|uniref:cadherin repeat domain-containing protein n=1 Tax=Lentimicrobium sp. TaxID=2034841 RepID=UPI0025DDD133|nr:cadherin repeat domain-containing protein [Lentimicrobium sp.]MCO5255942.1 cadherin repeat domain-containing protein [Lentimicrobium sp.]